MRRMLIALVVTLLGVGTIFIASPAHAGGVSRDCVDGGWWDPEITCETPEFTKSGTGSVTVYYDVYSNRQYQTKWVLYKMHGAGVGTMVCSGWFNLAWWMESTICRNIGPGTYKAVINGPANTNKYISAFW